MAPLGRIPRPKTVNDQRLPIHDPPPSRPRLRESPDRQGHGQPDRGVPRTDRGPIATDAKQARDHDERDLPGPRSTSIDVYTPEEVYSLSRAAADEHDRALYLTAAFTGLRQGELRAPRWRDVDFLADTIRVERSVTMKDALGTPKSGRARAVPMARAVAEELARLSKRCDRV
jgi:integrase